jgi:hypothetical protein
MRTEKYETSLGVVLTLKPISPDILSAIHTQIKFPEPPTYEHELIGGEKEVLYHTEKTLETEEEKTAWNNYLEELRLANREYYERKIRAIFRRCIILDMPEDDEWKILLRQDGINIPEDPIELKYLYLTTQTIGSPNDPIAIMEIVDKLSSFDEEELETVRSMFRRSI